MLVFNNFFSDFKPNKLFIKDKSLLKKLKSGLFVQKYFLKFNISSFAIFSLFFSVIVEFEIIKIKFKG